MKTNNTKYLIEYISSNNIRGEYYYSELFDVVFIDNRRISTCSDETSKFLCYYVDDNRIKQELLYPPLMDRFKKADATIRNIILLEEI